MKTPAEKLAAEGFVAIEEILNAEEISQIRGELADEAVTSAGDRRFLDREWCRLVSHVLRHRLLKRRLLYMASQPVLCTYFHKDAAINWGVNIHRDLHVPLRARLEHPNWVNWSEKQGIVHAQAPLNLLAEMLAVRVNIDDCVAGDGGLCVVPGSHLKVDIDTARIECTGPAGSAIAMSPLLLHTSTKSRSGEPRRVLHFLFGPSALPDGAEWYYPG